MVAFVATNPTLLTTKPLTSSPPTSPSQRTWRVSRRGRPSAVHMKTEAVPEETDSTPPEVTPDSDTTEPAQTEEEACAACGRLEGPVRGCDGSGRIAGGMGAVLEWWPIKAYRPCPELAKAKKQYKKSGQSLEEIAFGRK